MWMAGTLRAETALHAFCPAMTKSKDHRLACVFFFPITISRSIEFPIAR